MSKIAYKAAVKPVFLFYFYGLKESKQCQRFLLLDLIKATSKKVG